MRNKVPSEIKPGNKKTSDSTPTSNGGVLDQGSSSGGGEK